MKIKNTWLRAALLFAAGSIAGISSSSAAVATAQNGDLFIAFRASSGQGATTTYIVNIGQAATYNTATGSFNLSVGNTGADLVAAYGSEWNTRTDLSWGVFGYNAGASTTLYSSKERTSVGAQSTPWNVITTTNRTSVGTQLSSVITNSTNGYNLQNATTNSSVAVFQTNSAGAGYAYQVTGNGSTDFGSLSQWSSIEGTFGNGTAGTVLDLYRLTGSTTYVGNFGINNSGQIAFNAVPEPTAALLGSIGFVLLLGNRRRNA